jgi:phosphate transport system substrate-binding protein
MNRSRIIKAIVVLILICSIATYYYIYPEVEEKEDKDDEESKGFSMDNYPKVDGSTSAHPLAVIVACDNLGVNYTWRMNYYDGTKRVFASSTGSEDKNLCDYINRNINHNGTHSSYVNLIEKKADLILAARLPSEDELELAKETGVELVAKPIALDAFVFILNVQNPINSLSIDQIQQIYMGNITKWAEIGGRQTNISVYRRNDNSGSEELMKSLVMKDLKMIDAPDMWILYGMMGPINMLTEDENGICYSVYFFKEFMAPNEQIKLCGVNGIVPSYENISSRVYTYTTEVYVVIRKDQKENSKAFQLRDWLLSAAGQKVIKESGYVPINNP